MTGFDLLQWRQRMGWTQERAAEELGYSRRNYIRLEHRPDAIPERAAKLADSIERLQGVYYPRYLP